jgi:hypothetical protein
LVAQHLDEADKNIAAPLSSRHLYWYWGFRADMPFISLEGLLEQFECMLISFL